MSSEGPNSPSSGADDGDVWTTWINPGNITASDNAYATVSLLLTQANKLLATGFGFAIPSGATIDGIVVEWERSVSTGTDTIADAASRIIKGGVVGATDKSVVGNWTATDTYQSYGSSSDLWGETWTDADINAANFGAAISVQDTATGGTAQVDHCRITVYYTAADSQLPGVVTIARRPDEPIDPMFLE